MKLSGDQLMEHLPDEGSECEHGVIYRTGENHAPEGGWETTAYLE
jgi:hypothetical protein